MEFVVITIPGIKQASVSYSGYTQADSIISVIIKVNAEKILEELQACQTGMGNYFGLCHFCLIYLVTGRVPESIREVFETSIQLLGTVMVATKTKVVVMEDDHNITMYSVARVGLVFKSLLKFRPVAAKATVIIITIIIWWKELIKFKCNQHIKPKKNGTPTAKHNCPSDSAFSQLLWVSYKATTDNKCMDMEPTGMFVNSEEQGPSGMKVSLILRPPFQLMMSYSDGFEQFVDGSLEQKWHHLNQCNETFGDGLVYLLTMNQEAEWFADQSMVEVLHFSCSSLNIVEHTEFNKEEFPVAMKPTSDFISDLGGSEFLDHVGLEMGFHVIMRSINGTTTNNPQVMPSQAVALFSLR
ncbi:hypothetical protein VNO77_22798 [Canavalia gladiata]|uniref:Uncharacterized protein n=1 Tax=Canavalia gladiata TaxID=3824 RepID=A0AAN9L476_CANGL